MSAIRNSAKAVIIRHNKLLCIECVDPQGTYYILPGGGQEHGETLIDALKRECREEISAEVTVHDIRFIREYLSGHHEFAEFEPDVHQIEFMFICSLKEGSECKPGCLPDSSQVGVAWLPLETLHEFRLYPKALIERLTDDSHSTSPTEVNSPPQMPAFRNPSIYLGDVN